MMTLDEFERALENYDVQRQDKDLARNPDSEWQTIPASLLLSGLSDNVQDIGLAVVTLKEGATYFGVFANYRLLPVTNEEGN